MSEISTYRIDADALTIPEPHYAVVRSHGCYGSGETIYAVRVCGSLQTAITLAERKTRQYRQAMARHGGSSGGYRVIETHFESRRRASWVGHDLDAILDAQ